MQMRHTLFWRQDPEDSFSDWRIILESSEDADTAENNTAVLENQSDVSDFSSSRELAGDAQNINTAGINNNNHDEIDVLSNEVTPLTTTFHVHRYILAGGSTYFRSLFKKRKNNQTSEHETQTSTIKLKPEAVKSFPAFLDYVYNRNLGILGFERSNAVCPSSSWDIISGHFGLHVRVRNTCGQPNSETKIRAFFASAAM